MIVLAVPASASVTVTGIVTGPSVPAAYTSAKYLVTLGPGDRIAATMTYAGDDAHDLDLMLFSPFYDALPLVGTIQGGDPDAIVAIAQHYAAQRVGRTTCTDATASSQEHLGADGGSESFDVTLGANAESGAYPLYVSAFTALDGVPYTLTVTITDADGRDVSAARGLALQPATSTTNAWFYCDAAGRELLN